MPYLSVPQESRGRKPVSSAQITAQVVAANCARLGLPVPVALFPANSYQAVGKANTGRAVPNGAVPLTDKGFGFGGTSYLDAGSSRPIAYNQPFTFGWKEYQIASVSFGTVAGYKGSGGTYRCLFLRYNGSEYGPLQVGGTGGGAKFTDATWSTGVWNTFVVVGYAGPDGTGTANWDAWMNGVKLTKAAPGSLTSQTADNWYLGWDGVDGKMNGYLDVPTWWDVALTEAQIALWTSSPYSLLAPPQRRVWFDVGGGAGTVASDSLMLFDVRALVQVGATCPFDLLNLVQAGLGSAFDVLGLVRSDGKVVYDAYATVEGGLVLVFDVGATAASELRALYDAGGQVWGDLTASFLIRRAPVGGGGEEEEVILHLGPGNPFLKIFRRGALH